MDWQDSEAAHPIVVADELLTPHPITQCTANRYGMVLSSTDQTTGEDRYFTVHVSAHRAGLALRIVDAFVRACEVRGFELRHDSTNFKHDGLSVFIDGEPLPLGLYERGASVTHLSLEYGRHPHIRLRRRLWKDHPRRPLAGKLNAVMFALRAEVAERFAIRRENEEYDRRMLQLQSERQQLSRRVSLEHKAVAALGEEADGWQRAQIIRAYVTAVEMQAAQPPLGRERETWCQWARQQADRLEPLTLSPPSILDTPRDAYRELGHDEAVGLDGTIEHA